MKLTTNKKFNQPKPGKSQIKSPKNKIPIRNHKEIESPDFLEKKDNGFFEKNESSDSNEDSFDDRKDENKLKVYESKIEKNPINCIELRSSLSNDHQRNNENQIKIQENDKIFIDELQIEKNRQNPTPEKQEMKISGFTGSEIQINNKDNHDVSFECKNKSGFLKESEIIPQGQISRNSENLL